MIVSDSFAGYHVTTPAPEEESQGVNKALATMTPEERAKVRQMKLLTFFLYALRGNVYDGTVPPAVVRKRRAKNKVARRSRRLNRR